MRSDGFSLPRFADHEQLRQNSNALQVNAEGPQNLRNNEQI